MLRLIYITMTATILFLSSSSFANYSELHASISNQTDTACELIQPENVHGIVESSPPLSLMKGASDSFDMQDSYVYGPDEILSYECGTKQVKFEIFQPFGLFWGQTPTAHEISSNGLGITVPYIQSASRLVGSRGLINI